MPRTTYRIDLVDEKGALIGRRWFTLRSDNEALELAAKVFHPHGIKVWDGQRLVGALRRPD